MRFSVVIVNYGSWPLTVGCLGSLYATGHEDLEVVVVDNDDTEPPPLPGPARVISNRQNLGFARACNQGISATSGDLVVLVNPDAVVERDYFRSVEYFFAEHPSTGIAGPKILDPDGSVQLSARRELSMVSGLLGRTSLLTRLLPRSAFVKKHFPAVTRPTGPTPVDWVSGACMIVRRRVLEEVGLLDERYFMYFEDADLCRRARDAGWSVYYLPETAVTHRAGSSTRSRPLAIWRLHKSAFLYHRKHGAHGPLGLYSLLVLVGLGGRALAKLVSSLAGRP